MTRILSLECQDSSHSAYTKGYTLFHVPGGTGSTRKFDQRMKSIFFISSILLQLYHPQLNKLWARNREPYRLGRGNFIVNTCNTGFPRCGEQWTEWQQSWRCSDDWKYLTPADNPYRVWFCPKNRRCQVPALNSESISTGAVGKSEDCRLPKQGVERLWILAVERRSKHGRLFC